MTRGRDRAVRTRLTGIVAASLAVFVMCVGVALVNPPLVTPDETAHLDYAVHVWNGGLPVFDDGTTVHVTPPAKVPPVQVEAHHPPLYYALLAPVSGPLSNAGHWVAGTLAARILTAFFTALLVLASAWAAALLVPGSRAWPVAVAAVMTTLGPVVFVGGAAFGDGFNALLTVLAAGLAVQAVGSGLTRSLLVRAAAVSAAGALTNAEFVIPLLVLGGALAGAALARRAPPLLARLGDATLAGALPGVAAVVAAGWFYARNLRLSGHLSGAHPAWAAQHLHRHPLTLSRAVQSRGFYKTHWSLLRHPLDGRTRAKDTLTWLDMHVMVGLLAVVVAVGLVVIAVAVRRAVLARRWQQLACWAVPAAFLGVDLLFELRYFMSGGGTISRYLMPALLTVAVIIASAFEAVPRRTLALGCYLALCYGFFLAWLETRALPAQWDAGAVHLLVRTMPLLLLGLLAVQLRAHSLLSRGSVATA